MLCSSFEQEGAKHCRQMLRLAIEWTEPIKDKLNSYQKKLNPGAGYEAQGLSHSVALAEVISIIL